MACSRAAGPAPDVFERHLVLITVDTWRADYLMQDRAGSALTPNLARFARHCVRFQHAQSVSTATSPGLAGILTGLTPSRSGVRKNVHILQAQITTLAERLRAAGFVTGALVANPVVEPGYGFEQGFDDYRLGSRPVRGKRAGNTLTSEAIDWLAARADSDRFFLWVHYMEPHGPYDPPPETAALFDRELFDSSRHLPLLAEGDNSGRHGVPFYQWKRVPKALRRDGRSYLARYAAEVRFFDSAVSRLLSELDERGQIDESVIVITADHGEALDGDHGYFFSHDNELTEDQIHVPLLLCYPGHLAGTRVEEPVSTLDIAPTVLELLGLADSVGPDDFDGRALLERGPRKLVGETGDQWSLREGSWKLRWLRGRGPIQLVDLDSDPNEEANVADSKRAEALRADMQAIGARPPLATPVSREDDGSDELIRALEALGYL